ncbi:MAG: branched-chain amino acid ABC transporter permease [Thermodesulfobacteriota bacterium]
MSDFLMYLTNGVVIGIIYALSALGVSLIVGIMNVVNFAHGELYILAGYFSALIAAALGLGPAPAMLLAVAAVFALGLIIEWTMIRPTYGDDMYSLIITFIFSIILQNAYLFIFGPYPQKPPSWIGGATNLFGLFFYGNQRLLSLAAAVVVIGLFFLLIHKTWFGRVVRAVSMDREVASTFGVNPVMVNLLAFGAGCALAAAAGVILTPIFPVTPTVGVGVSLTAFVVVVLGGMGSFSGCVAGGLILGIVENLGAAYVDSGYKHLFGFVILILVLFFRPAGLFGQKQL